MLHYFISARAMNGFNPTQALMSLAFWITFVSVFMCFLITLMLVNMCTLNENQPVNSCNVLYIYQIIVTNKLDLILRSTPNLLNTFSRRFLMITKVFSGWNIVQCNCFDESAPFDDSFKWIKDELDRLTPTQQISFPLALAPWHSA